MDLEGLLLQYAHFALLLWHISEQKWAEMYQKLQSPISPFHYMQRDRILTIWYWYAWWVVPNQLIDLVYLSQFSQSVRRRMRTLACARAVSPNIDPLPINTNTSQSHTLRRLFCLISAIHCKSKPVPISELANQSQSIAKLGKNEALAFLLDCFSSLVKISLKWLLKHMELKG